MTDKMTTEQMLAYCTDLIHDGGYNTQIPMWKAIREALAERDALKLELGLTAEQLLLIRAENEDIIEKRDALKGTKEEWFSKGRESVLRNNQSGCCCLFNEQDEIVSLCAAHKEREDALKAEVDHRCDQRDAALESVSLLTKEVERLKKPVKIPKRENRWRYWKARAEKAEADLAAALEREKNRLYRPKDEIDEGEFYAQQTPAPPEEPKKVSRDAIIQLFVRSQDEVLIADERDWVSYMTGWLRELGIKVEEEEMGIDEYREVLKKGKK